jgi:hypothetical protein
MTNVGGCDPPSRGYGGGCDKPVVGPDLSPSRGQPSPEPRMDPRYKKIEGKHREGREHSLHKRFASSTVRLCSSVHTVQQLRGCDRGDSHLLFIERNTLLESYCQADFPVALQ